MIREKPAAVAGRDEGGAAAVTCSARLVWEMVSVADGRVASVSTELRLLGPYREALRSVDAYAALPETDRDAIVRWVETRRLAKERAGGDHFANFIDCVRSRKEEDLHAPIEEGHISCALVHLANPSCRLGRTLQFDPEKQEVIDDAEANRLLRDGERG